MILITGASGNVGSALVKHTEKNNIDYIGTSFSKTFAGLYKIDLSSEKQVKTMFIKNKFSSIIHCASSLNSSLKDYLSNINQAINICKYFTGNVINISTSGLYNLEGNKVINEESELKIKKMYWLSKKHCEDIFSLNCKPENLINLRISAPYSTSRESRSIIYTMVNNAMLNNQIKFWGSGSRTQTFTNVNTLAEDIYKMIYFKIFGTFNYATSHNITMLELAELIATIFLKFGKKINVLSAENIDPEENFRCSIDTSKIKKYISIKNTFVEDIEEIIKAKLCL